MQSCCNVFFIFVVVNIIYLTITIKTNKMNKQGIVITTDLKLVKVNPVAIEADELALTCAAVDDNGNIYVWGVLKHFLPNEKTILNQCWDENVNDLDFINITLGDYPEALEQCMLDYFK